MATVTVTSLPDVITSGSTDESELSIPELSYFEGFPRGAGGMILKVTVLTGSGIKFNNIGNAADSSLTVTTSNSPILITLPKGRNIHFKATGADDTFMIEG